MTSASRLPLARRWRRAGSLPLAKLAPVLAAALVLMLLPDRATAPLKRVAAAVLAPGQTLAAGGRQWVARRLELWQWRLASADEQRATVEELAELRRRSSELETALALALARDSSPPAAPGEKRCQEPLIPYGRRGALNVLGRSKVPGTFVSGESPAAGAPLLHADLVRTRVLGPQARAYLERLDVLGAGSRQGLQPGATVFPAASSAAGDLALLDQGQNAGLDVDDLALAGRSIAGKLIEVGPQTATMQRLTEPGYRDLVQLARASGERLRLGANGVLEGNGERLCRISMIEITEPVSAGDLVVAADASGGSLPGVYGRVTRAERRPGDAHWQIWMAPAIGDELPGEVDVLRLRLNPGRVAAAQREAP
ncbi:MAG TPA: rod shape-determining protein MreC [Pirellulales bacterium]|nr:rod shape-determining protein MreC [Pirellulales bacterium]